MNPVERHYTTQAHVQEIQEIAGKVDAVLDELPPGAEKEKRLHAMFLLQRAAEVLKDVPTPDRDLTAMLQASVLIFGRKRPDPAPGNGANGNAG